MTLDEARDFIKASLGGVVPIDTNAGEQTSYGLDVELNIAHIDTAIHSALNWLSVYAPRKGTVEMLTTPGVSRYDMTNSLPPNAEIVEVRIGKGEGILGSLDLWAVSVLQEGATWDLMDLAYLLNYAGVTRRIFGTDFTWEYRKPFLYISPKPDKSYVLSIDYVVPYTMVEEVPFKYLDAFLTFARGEAKEILGRIRGKYSGVPAPEGTVELDADTLLQEGREDKERAREILNRLLPSPGFVVG